MSNGRIGTPMQGVNQQHPRVRPQGTATEQINFMSDVVQGLTSRPALVEYATLRDQPHLGLRFLDAKLGGVEYIVGYKPGVLRMWTAEGVEQTVTAIGAALDYIGSDMIPYVHQDAGTHTMLLANRDMTVQKAAAPDASSILPQGSVGMVYCKGGKFSRTYRITMRYSDGTVVDASYLTPDGSAAGDADKTSAAYIMARLYDNISTLPTWKASTTKERVANVLYLRCTTHDFTLTVSDSDSGDTIVGFTTRVVGTESLPKFAPHGYLVRATGSDDGTADDMLFRFNSDVVTVVGTGMGTAGVWEEYYDPTQISAFDLTTMPHAIVQVGPGEFELRQGDWEGRHTGDDDTNPFPEFVGSQIRDMSGFQSRLVMATVTRVIASRTNKPYSLFKSSAATELDTDPISVYSTEGGDMRVDWIIPFDRDLVFMSDPGKGQYVLSGSAGKLTPANAALVRTTAFEMQGGAKPVESGRTVMFPFKSGRYSGIKEFFTNDQVATNGADTLTEGCDKYIKGLVDHMRVGVNFNLAVFKTDSPDTANTAWVYKYLWNGTEKLQSSWSKWVFPHHVRFFQFSGSLMRVILEAPPSSTGQADLIFCYMDLDIPDDDVFGYHVCLDRQVRKTTDAASSVVLPYGGASFVQSTGCITPGRQVQAAVSGPSAAGDWTYTFNTDTVPNGAEVVCGLRYTRSVSPTMPYVRDRNGAVVAHTNLVITEFSIEYVNTGYIQTQMDSKYRENPVVVVSDWFATDDDVNDVYGNGLRSGVLDVPWGESTDWSALTIESDDPRPTTLVDLQYRSQVFQG